MVAKKKIIGKKPKMVTDPASYPASYPASEPVIEQPQVVTQQPQVVTEYRTVSDDIQELDKPDVIDARNTHLADCIVNRFFRNNAEAFNKHLYHLLGVRFGYHVPEMKRREKLWK